MPLMVRGEGACPGPGPRERAAFLPLRKSPLLPASFLQAPGCPGPCGRTGHRGHVLACLSRSLEAGIVVSA